MGYQQVGPQYDFGKTITTNPTGDVVVNLVIIDMNEVAGKIPILILEDTLSIGSGNIDIGLLGSFDKVTWYPAKRASSDIAIALPASIVSLVDNHQVIYPLDAAANWETLFIPFAYRYMRWTLINVAGNNTATITTRTVVI